MGTLLGWMGVYVAAAALFYLRLTATATSGLVPKMDKPLHRHRARHLTKNLGRRACSTSLKHWR